MPQTPRLLSSNFSYILLRASIFTPRFPDDGEQILGVLRAFENQRFNSQPILVPVSDSNPFLILRDDSDQWRFVVSSNRIDFTWVEMFQRESPPDIFEFFHESIDFFKYCLDSFDFVINRVAVNVESALRIENPEFHLAGHFCQTRFQTIPFNRPKSFEINSLKQYNLKVKITP